MLELTWQDARTSSLQFRKLRAACPCAVCVNEITGERLVDPATIPEDIEPKSISISGNYAIRIAWSDGHSTGLYTWDLLAELAPCSKSS
jgi:DUF971 family protein